MSEKRQEEEEQTNFSVEIVVQMTHTTKELKDIIEKLVEVICQANKRIEILPIKFK